MEGIEVARSLGAALAGVLPDEELAAAFGNAFDAAKTLIEEPVEGLARGISDLRPLLEKIKARADNADVAETVDEALELLNSSRPLKAAVDKIRPGPGPSVEDVDLGPLFTVVVDRALEEPLGSVVLETYVDSIVAVFGGPDEVQRLYTANYGSTKLDETFGREDFGAYYEEMPAVPGMHDAAATLLGLWLGDEPPDVLTALAALAPVITGAPSEEALKRALYLTWPVLHLLGLDSPAIGLTLGTLVHETVTGFAAAVGPSVPGPVAPDCKVERPPLLIPCVAPGARGVPGPATAAARFGKIVARPSAEPPRPRKWSFTRYLVRVLVVGAMFATLYLFYAWRGQTAPAPVPVPEPEPVPAPAPVSATAPAPDDLEVAAEGAAAVAWWLLKSLTGSSSTTPASGAEMQDVPVNATLSAVANNATQLQNSTFVSEMAEGVTGATSEFVRQQMTAVLDGVLVVLAGMKSDAGLLASTVWDGGATAIAKAGALLATFVRLEEGNTQLPRGFAPVVLGNIVVSYLLLALLKVFTYIDFPLTSVSLVGDRIRGWYSGHMQRIGETLQRQDASNRSSVITSTVVSMLRPVVWLTRYVTSATVSTVGKVIGTTLAAAMFAAGVGTKVYMAALTVPGLLTVGATLGAMLGAAVIFGDRNVVSRSLTFLLAQAVVHTTILTQGLVAATYINLQLSEGTITVEPGVIEDSGWVYQATVAGITAEAGAVAIAIGGLIYDARRRV